MFHDSETYQIRELKKVLEYLSEEVGDDHVRQGVCPAADLTVGKNNPLSFHSFSKNFSL